MANIQPNVRWFNNVIPARSEAARSTQQEPPTGKGSKKGEAKD